MAVVIEVRKDFLTRILFAEAATKAGSINMYVDNPLSFLHSEGGIVNARTWFRQRSQSLTHCWSEVDVLAFLGEATDMPEHGMLSLFDLLDADDDGFITFSDFFVLLSCLFGVDMGDTRRVLYMHQEAMWDMIVALDPLSSDPMTSTSPPLPPQALPDALASSTASAPVPETSPSPSDSEKTIGWTSFARLGWLFGIPDYLMRQAVTSIGLDPIDERLTQAQMSMYMFAVLSVFDDHVLAQKNPLGKLLQAKEKMSASQDVDPSLVLDDVLDDDYSLYDPHGHPKCVIC